MLPIPINLAHSLGKLFRVGCVEVPWKRSGANDLTLLVDELRVVKQYGPHRPIFDRFLDPWHAFLIQVFAEALHEEDLKLPKVGEYYKPGLVADSKSLDCVAFGAHCFNHEFCFTLDYKL